MKLLKSTSKAVIISLAAVGLIPQTVGATTSNSNNEMQAILSVKNLIQLSAVKIEATKGDTTAVFSETTGI